MARQFPEYLRVHTQWEETAAGEPERGGELDALCRSFQLATGFALTLIADGETASAAESWSTAVEFTAGGQGCLNVRAARTTGPTPDARDLEHVKPLVASVAQLLSELERTRQELVRREAELAAGVPVTLREDEQIHLAQRLEAILRGGAQALGCQAAAAYFLDEATSELKLRACWGLPQQRFLEAARPLRGAVADLEALVGHAVVLDDAQLLPHWKAPEEFASAVCVPIASPTTPLGTLWVFSTEKHNFTDEQTQLLEIVAGRVATELEREILLQTRVPCTSQDRQLGLAAQWQHDRLPQFAPLVDDWQVAGWSSPAEIVGGDFHDWCVLPNGALSVAVGDADGTQLQAALAAATVQISMRAHALYRHDAGQMLSRVNDTLWSSSPGDQFASLWYAIVDPESGNVEYAQAGAVGAWIVSGCNAVSISQKAASLGTQPDAGFPTHTTKLAAGDMLIVVSQGVIDAFARRDQLLDERQLADLLGDRPRAPQEVVELLRSRLLGPPQPMPTDDLSILVARRRP